MSMFSAGLATPTPGHGISSALLEQRATPVALQCTELQRRDNIDDLKVVTLQDAIYMEMKNDIAFLVGTDIHLWEHQSTVNPNMPVTPNGVTYEFAAFACGDRTKLAQCG